MMIRAVQVVAVVEAAAKLQWLKERLPALIDAGDVLVFAAQKVKVDEVTAQLTAAGFRCVRPGAMVPARGPLCPGCIPGGCRGATHVA